MMRSVDARICYARGRGFDAYVGKCKAAVDYAKRKHYEIVCTVIGNEIYEPNLMIQIA